MSNESRPMEVIKHNLDCKNATDEESGLESMISGMLSSFR